MEVFGNNYFTTVIERYMVIIIFTSNKEVSSDNYFTAIKERYAVIIILLQ